MRNKVHSIVLVDIQWNSWNGFYFTILEIDYSTFNERALFSFWTNWKDHVVINFLFLEYNNRKNKD